MMTRENDENGRKCDELLRSSAFSGHSDGPARQGRAGVDPSAVSHFRVVLCRCRRFAVLVSVRASTCDVSTNNLLFMAQILDGSINNACYLGTKP